MGSRASVGVQKNKNDLMSSEIVANINTKFNLEKVREETEIVYNQIRPWTDITLHEIEVDEYSHHLRRDRELNEKVVDRWFAPVSDNSEEEEVVPVKKIARKKKIIKKAAQQRPSAAKTEQRKLTKIPPPPFVYRRFKTPKTTYFRDN